MESEQMHACDQFLETGNDEADRAAKAVAALHPQPIPPGGCFPQWPRLESCNCVLASAAAPKTSTPLAILINGSGFVESSGVSAASD